MFAGLKPGTREWLYAVSNYHAHEPLTLQLCQMLQQAWDDIEAMKGQPNGPEKRTDTTDRHDDEWNS